MSKESLNGEAMANGLRQISSEALKRQILVNEAYEQLNVAATQFFRLYNGGSTDVEMIQERAQRVTELAESFASMTRSVSKPYLD